jgi:hypothetical protein
MIKKNNLIYFAVLIYINLCSFVMHGDIKHLIEAALNSESEDLLSRTTEDSILYSDGIFERLLSREEFKFEMDTFFNQNPIEKADLIINQNSAYNKREFLWNYNSKNKKTFKFFFLCIYNERESHYHLNRLIIEELANESSPIK